MNDAASFDAIMQCNLLEVFCEALGAAIFVTDKLDQLTFASIRLLHIFPIREAAIEPGSRARELYGALYDSGCRFGNDSNRTSRTRDDWIAERIACAWKERVDKIEQVGPDRWMRIVSRRFSSGLGFVVMQDVSEQKKKEALLKSEQERVWLTEEILDTLPVPVAVKDRNLNFVAVNQAFSAVTGLPADQIVGRGIWDVVEPELAGQMEQADWQLLASGMAHHSPIQLSVAGDETVKLEQRSRRLGKPGHHYISMTLADITARATAGGTMQATTQAAPGAAAADLSIDHSPAARNALCLLSKVQARPALTLALRAHGIELCMVHDPREFAALIPAAREAGIAIDFVVIDANFPALAFNMLAQWSLRFRMVSENAEDATLMAEILHGMEASTPATIQQQSCARPRQHGAEPLAWSRPDADPLAADVPMPDIHTPDGLSMDMASPDVLAVEDNAINRLALRQILESLDLNFSIATTAAEALQQIAAHRPRLILTDTTLPDMPLGTFASELAHRAPGVPVLGLIPADTDDNRKLCASAGFLASLSKPLSAELLGALIGRHMAGEMGMAGTAA